ncbi:MAG: hypothetical protein ACJAVZ_002076 [Afipia broomeae]|jgi:hypothetical protein
MKYLLVAVMLCIGWHDCSPYILGAHFHRRRLSHRLSPMMRHPIAQALNTSSTLANAQRTSAQTRRV